MGNVEVVLTQDDPKLGKRGQVIKVARGFAYNFLVPQGKAKLATPAVLKSAGEEEARLSKKEAETRKKTEELAQKIEETSLTIEVSAGEEDKLYGAVTSADIQQALSARGILLDKKDIQLEEPIKKLGAYEINVKLHPAANAKLKLWVVKKK